MVLQISIMILVTSMKLDFTKGRRGAGKGRGERVVEVEVATHVAGSSNGWCMVRMLCRAILKRWHSTGRAS